jgi:hypothetical protein
MVWCVVTSKFVCDHQPKSIVGCFDFTYCAAHIGGAVQYSQCSLVATQTETLECDNNGNVVYL